MNAIDQLKSASQSIARSSQSMENALGVVLSQRDVLLCAVRLAEFHFRAYASYHEAKGDTEKCDANTKLADQMVDAVYAVS